MSDSTQNTDELTIEERERIERLLFPNGRPEAAGAKPGDVFDSPEGTSRMRAFQVVERPHIDLEETRFTDGAKELVNGAIFFGAPGISSEITFAPSVMRKAREEGIPPSDMAGYMRAEAMKAVGSGIIDQIDVKAEGYSESGPGIVVTCSTHAMNNDRFDQFMTAIANNIQAALAETLKANGVDPDTAVIPDFRSFLPHIAPEGEQNDMELVSDITTGEAIRPNVPGVGEA